MAEQRTDLLIGIQAICRVYRIGRDTLNEMINHGAPIKKFNGRWTTSVSMLDKYMREEVIKKSMSNVF